MSCVFWCLKRYCEWRSWSAPGGLPQLEALALHEVARLQAVQPVLVRHRDELVIARAPGALVRRVREVRVAVLAVLADDLRSALLSRLTRRLFTHVESDVHPKLDGGDRNWSPYTET